VLNRVRDDEMERYLRSRLAEKGIHPIGAVHEQSSISTSWMTGTALATAGAQAEAEAIIEELERRQRQV